MAYMEKPILGLLKTESRIGRPLFRVRTAIVLVLLLILAIGAGLRFTDRLPALAPARSSKGEAGDLLHLARQSAGIYQEMVNGGMDGTSGWEALLPLSCKASRVAMETYRDKFLQSVAQTRDHLASSGNPIRRFAFAEPVLEPDGNRASVSRIQIHEDGTKHWFRQDFLREDGVWRIRGDNPIDPFRLKIRFPVLQS